MKGHLGRRGAAFSETAIDDEVVLLNLADGTFFSLAGTAAAIWALIDGTRDRRALLAALATAHGVPEAEIAADVDVFLAQLDEAGFLDRG